MSSRAVGSLTTGLLALCLSVSLNTDAMPSQTAVPGEPKAEPRVRPEPAKLSKVPVLARNSTATARTEPTATAATAKKASPEAKGTISRCWKRLMDNVREVSRAHRNRQK